MKKARLKLALACGAAFFIGCACCLSLRSVYYEFETGKLEKPVKIAFLSDVHNSLYGTNQSQLISEIEKFGADIVLFGGDLFDEHNGEKNSWTLVDALVPKYPCYYSIGNHEIYRGDQNDIKRQMTEHGVTVLADSTELVEINGEKIRICGTESVWDEKAQAQLDENYSVLMHHYPGDFPEMSKKGFDLILSGHAHGGQWRIPGVLNGLFAPDEGLFPEYAGGIYTENGTTMAVSRGLYKNISCLFIPRIFNRPELLLITLK